MTFIDDAILKYLSDDEKDTLQEIIEKASYRLTHEDDELFEEGRCHSEIGEDVSTGKVVNLFGKEEEEGQTNLFERVEEDVIAGLLQQSFFGGKLDAYCTLVHNRIISLEYCAGLLQKPIDETEEMYDSWCMVFLGEDGTD